MTIANPVASSLRLSATTSALLVIDIQERLLPAIEPGAAERLMRSASMLTEAARLFGVPIVATEQYPKGLGCTVATVREALGAVEPVAKVEFSAARCAAAFEALQRTGCRSVVLIGMETHVCVLQTALDLLVSGLAVHVVADGVGSRTEVNRQLGLELMRQGGAAITCAETVGFQWAERAGTDAFKALSRLVR